MRFSHRLFLLLILLLTGAPILAQEPSDVAKNVRMMVSGIVSYTRWATKVMYLFIFTF